MAKTIGRSTPIMLLATLFIAIGSQLSLQADANQFLFDMEAIQDPGSLVVKLQDTRAPVSKFIASQLSEDMQWVLVGYNGTSTPSPQQQAVLLADLNRLLQMDSLYDAQRFANIEISEQTQALIAENPQSGEALVRLNRCLLSDAYPYELASLSEEQSAKEAKGIETCRENLRQIKRARDDYKARQCGCRATVAFRTCSTVFGQKSASLSSGSDSRKSRGSHRRGSRPDTAVQLSL